MAAVLAAIATLAATFVVVEAAIAYNRPVFDLFIFPDNSEARDTLSVRPAWSGSFIFYGQVKLNFVISVLV